MSGDSAKSFSAYGWRCLPLQRERRERIMKEMATESVRVCHQEQACEHGWLLFVRQQRC